MKNKAKKVSPPVLVDTSIWVQALDPKERNLSEHLAKLVSGDEVLGHEMVLAELMLVLRGERRNVILEAYDDLTPSMVIDRYALTRFIQTHNLAQTGLSFVECHLLAAAERQKALVWSESAPVKKVARVLNIAFDAPKGSAE